MSDSDNNCYTPPRVWASDTETGGRFASINRPVAGPTHDKALPLGKHIIMARATNSAGVSQPLTQNWNPSGYNRAGVDPVRVEIA